MESCLIYPAARKDSRGPEICFCPRKMTWVVVEATFLLINSFRTISLIIIVIHC